MTNSPHVLYLLHFPQRVSGAQHYLGITTLTALRQRLTTHCAGFGSGLTSRAAFECEHMNLVALWTKADYKLERRIKDGGHLRQYCCVCSGDLRGRQRRVHHVDIQLMVPRIPHTAGLAKPLDFPTMKRTRTR